MKNLVTCTLLLLALTLPATTAAYDFEVDGIYYDFNGSDVAVTYKTASYNSYSGDVTIPSTVTFNGMTYSVTSIGQRAFQACVDLTSVTIPNTVTVIGYWAFYNCRGLKSVTIPNSVTSIGYQAFYHCRSLTSVCIPNSVTIIEDNAFAGCDSLTSLTIPSSVTSIGGGVFLWCSGLASIIVDRDNPEFDSRNDCNAIIKTSSNKLIVGCKNTIIPNSVSAIGQYAFWGCTGLPSVTIPQAVTTIGNGAFGGCIGLTSVTIPNAVISIGYRAFEGCSGLTDVTIPNSVTAIDHNAFYDCSGLTDVYCYKKDPSAISMGVDVFSQVSADYSGRTLHVPYGTADAYQTNARWYQCFGQIVEDLVPENVPGDVNGDDEVNIADVNAVINVILDGVGNPAADVNTDGEINIADINAVIDLILGDHQVFSITGSWYSEYFVDEDGKYDIPEPIAVSYDFYGDNSGRYSYLDHGSLIYIDLCWDLQGQRLYIWYADDDYEELYCRIDENGYLLMSLYQDFNNYTAYRPVSAAGIRVKTAVDGKVSRQGYNGGIHSVSRAIREKTRN